MRIAGVQIPDNKHVVVALTYIYGIGPQVSKELLAKFKVDPTTKTKDLTEDQERDLQNYIQDNIRIEGDLRREIQLNIKRLIDINCYRGTRHKKGLPVRGQRTKQNARTRKGKKKTASSGRIKAT